MALQGKDEPSQVERLGQVQQATGHLIGVLAWWEVHHVLMALPFGNAQQMNCRARASSKTSES